jgi:hypothetical protein
MEGAYTQVMDYQTNIEVKTYRRDGSFAIQKFLYTFKKPDRIRLDFETPHSGLVLVYPDQNGKAVLRPPGLGRFFALHLGPGNSLLRMSSGQRIDETDLGLLIKNIGHSLTDQRRGPVEFAEDDGYLRVRVLADDHFQKGVETLYQFLIPLLNLCGPLVIMGIILVGLKAREKLSVVRKERLADNRKFNRATRHTRLGIWSL